MTPLGILALSICIWQSFSLVRYGGFFHRATFPQLTKRTYGALVEARSSPQAIMSALYSSSSEIEKAKRDDTSSIRLFGDFSIPKGAAVGIAAAGAFAAAFTIIKVLSVVAVPTILVLGGLQSIRDNMQKQQAGGSKSNNIIVDTDLVTEIEGYSYSDKEAAEALGSSSPYRFAEVADKLDDTAKGIGSVSQSVSSFRERLQQHVFKLKEETALREQSLDGNGRYD